MICRRDECGQDSDNCPCPDERRDDDTADVIEVCVGIVLAVILIVAVLAWINSQGNLT